VARAEDKLFATLDPTSRQVRLGDGQAAIITDTVGFIHKLPHQLVDAFRATLEEVNRADVLLEVVDASDAHAPEHQVTVQAVLDELGAGDKPRIVVLNKADLVNPASADPALPAPITAGAVRISATTGYGLDELRLALGSLIGSLGVAVDLGDRPGCQAGDRPARPDQAPVPVQHLGVRAPRSLGPVQFRPLERFGCTRIRNLVLRPVKRSKLPAAALPHCLGKCRIFVVGEERERRAGPPLFSLEEQRHDRPQHQDRSSNPERVGPKQLATTLSRGAVADLIVVLEEADKARPGQAPDRTPVSATPVVRRLPDVHEHVPQGAAQVAQA